MKTEIMVSVLCIGIIVIKAILVQNTQKISFAERVWRFYGRIKGTYESFMTVDSEEVSW